MRARAWGRKWRSGEAAEWRGGGEVGGGRGVGWRVKRRCRGGREGAEEGEEEAGDPGGRHRYAYIFAVVSGYGRREWK